MRLLSETSTFAKGMWTHAAASKVLLMQPAAKARANKKKAEELKRQKEAQKESETVLTQWKAGLVDARIPLMPLSQKAEAAALDQLRNCTPLSPSDPVSCCMLTIPQVLSRICVPA